MPETDAQFEAFLTYLSTSRNFDFTAYKRASLGRRVRKRMQTIGIESYTDYTDYLEVHPEEFTELFNTILINVTSFFRDAPAWEFLAAEIVPTILKNKGAHEPVRLWSAGSASGEEAYSLAMLLAEAMGETEFRVRVKIYATDVDEEALNLARQATYSAKDLTAVPEDLREKYFESSDQRYSFRKDMRRAVIFGRHDLLQDAPISRVDLLVCRNALMYLNSEAQGRVLARFYFALNNGGYLFLGKAETLLTHTSMLVPIDLKLRVFAKIARPGAREALPQDNGTETLTVAVSQVRLRDIAFELDPVAQMTVDTNGFVASVNERARATFGLKLTDMGRPLQDLEISYRPVELRSLIEQAYSDHRAITLHDVELTGGAATRWLDIYVVPLPDQSNGVVGVKIAFNDVTAMKDLQRALQQSKNELETAYEELQSTNEELETTNEELQSTVEELETTNEELQSTNEELETMNEELQSTNEELETVNNEMRDRGSQLNDAKLFLESVLKSITVAVVVVDQDMQVQAWNRRAEDLWGLRTEEVQGKNLLNLDIGLPVGSLAQPVRAMLADGTAAQELRLDATNRRGRPIVCHIICTPLDGADSKPAGAIMLMSEEQTA